MIGKYNISNQKILRKKLLIYVIIFLGLFLLGLYFSYQHKHRQPNVVWQDISPGQSPLTQTEKQAIENAYDEQLVKYNGSYFAGHSIILKAQRQGDWVYVDGQDKNSQPIPGIVYFIAHFQNGKWSVWIGSDPSFCQQIAKIPNTLLDSTNKSYFCQ